MALLADVRKFFRRRRNATPAFADSQAASLVSTLNGGATATVPNVTSDDTPAPSRSSAPPAATATKPRPRTAEPGAPIRPAAMWSAREGSASGEADDSARGGGATGTRTTNNGSHANGRSTDANGETAKTSIVEARPARSRSERSKEELRELVENIEKRIDHHTARSDRIVELLSDVPSRLEVLPEMSRRQVALIETVQDHLDRIARRDEHMQSAITALAETSSQHAAMLEAIRAQIEDGNRGTDRLGDAVQELEGSLVALTRTQEQSNDVLVKMAEESNTRQTEFSRHVQNSQRWIVTAVLCCCGAAMAAVGTAILAVLTGG